MKAPISPDMMRIINTPRSQIKTTYLGDGKTRIQIGDDAWIVTPTQYTKPSPRRRKQSLIDRIKLKLKEVKEDFGLF